MTLRHAGLPKPGAHCFRHAFAMAVPDGVDAQFWTNTKSVQPHDTMTAYDAANFLPLPNQRTRINLV